MEIDVKEKLSLQAFIEYNLRIGKYPEFEWLSPQNKTFKLPWADKSKPGWETLDEICKAWVLNKDGRINGSDFTKRKGRFRDALRNSNCLEKLENLCVLNKQVGNYLVYKFLSPPEIEAKKKKNKKRVSSDQSTSSSPSSSQGNYELESPVELPDVLFNLSEVDISNLTQQISYSTDMTELSEIAVDANPGNNNNDIPNTTEDIPRFNNFSEFLRMCDVANEDFSTFEVTIQYDGYKCEPILIDFAQGCFFQKKGSPLNQKFQFPLFPLQESSVCNGKTELIKKILKGLEDGFAVRSTPEADELRGFRLSNAHIYFINCDTETELNVDKQYLKMEREKEVCLFSYFSYIIRMLQYRADKRKTRPSCEVILSFCYRPSSLLKDPIFSIRLRPAKIDAINNLLGFSEDSVSLLFSDKSSLISWLDECGEIPVPQDTGMFEDLLNDFGFDL